MTRVFLELRSSLSGLDSSAIWGWNLLSWWTIPRNPLGSGWSLGLSFCSIASTFLGSSCTPLESMTVSRNCTDGLENSHFSSFTVRLAFYNLWGVASRCSSCLWTELPKTRISSIWYRAPSVPSKACEVSLWKCWGAELKRALESESAK